METNITVRGVENPTKLREFAEGRLARALARFEDRILDVAMRLEDETGPAKKGHDKHCSIDVKLRSGGVRISEKGDQFEATINKALDRLKAALSREVAKAKRGIGEG
jgi:ribosomal subunit interface protein